MTMGDGDMDEMDDMMNDEFSPFDTRQNHEIYKKHSVFNPLIRDKGGVSGASLLTLNAVIGIGVQRLQQPTEAFEYLNPVEKKGLTSHQRLNSCRVLSTENINMNTMEQDANSPKSSNSEDSGVIVKKNKHQQSQPPSFQMKKPSIHYQLQMTNFNGTSGVLFQNTLINTIGGHPGGVTDQSSIQQQTIFNGTQKEVIQLPSSNILAKPEKQKETKGNRYLLQCDSFSRLTLQPNQNSSSGSSGLIEQTGKMNLSQQSSIDDLLMFDENGNPILEIMNDDGTLQKEGKNGLPYKQDDQAKIQQRAQSFKELNKLMKIEKIFFRRQPSIDRTAMQASYDFIRTDTADFPMKLVTHALIEESKDAMGSNNLLLPSDGVEGRQQRLGTPRFPTEEEIETEERRLLLSFAFKDADEIDKYRKEMSHIISSEFIVEKPAESKYRDLKYQCRRFEPSNKKTLVFCGVDGLFMFSTLAQIVKTCDRQVKIRKDGIKRRYKIFFRPHLYTFIKTLSQYFELVLYLSEEERVASQWVHVLNSFNAENSLRLQGKTAQQAKEQARHTYQNKVEQLKRKQTITEKFFDVILTREHCICDKQVKVACRNKDLLLDGRTLKNIVFIGCDLKDSMMVHQNAIIVRPYHGNKYENNLAKLKIYLLKHILECADVRDVIKRDFLCHLKAPASTQQTISIPMQVQPQLSQGPSSTQPINKSGRKNSSPKSFRLRQSEPKPLLYNKQSN